MSGHETTPTVSSYMPRNQDFYGYLPSFRHLSNTKLPSFAEAAIHCSCIVTYDVIYCARDKCRRTNRQTIKRGKRKAILEPAVRVLHALRLVKTSIVVVNNILHGVYHVHVQIHYVHVLIGTLK